MYFIFTLEQSKINVAKLNVLLKKPQVKVKIFDVIILNKDSKSEPCTHTV